MREDTEKFEAWFSETMSVYAQSTEGQEAFGQNIKRIKEIMRRSWKGAWHLKETELSTLKENHEKLLIQYEAEKNEKELLKQKNLELDAKLKKLKPESNNTVIRNSTEKVENEVREKRKFSIEKF